MALLSLFEIEISEEEIVRYGSDLGKDNCLLKTGARFGVEEVSSVK